MDSFAKLLGQQIPGNSTAAAGYVHKYLRNLVMHHFGTESLQQKLIKQVFEMACINLKSWSSQSSIEVKEASTSMIFELTSKQMLSRDSAKFSEEMSMEFNNFVQGLMSFPLNIPGTSFYRCLKKQEKALKMMKNILQERLASPQKRHADFLDQLIEGMKDENFLTEEFIVYIMFGLLLASFETISSSLTLAIKLLTDRPLVLKELMDEHVEILRTRENVDSAITWTEYKSMTFMSCVVNETLRLANVAPGILRRAMKDIQVKGYTIPAGWTIMVVPSALHMNPDKFENPLAFNPWRWKDDGLNVMSKHFIAFGGGTRNCAGAEFSKVLMSIFLHVMVTKYRWTIIKGGDIVRSPALGFKNGFHIKVVEK